MDILRLRLLVSVSHTLSFTRTAEDFFMTQPAVSHQIKSLEQALGVQLLERNPHRVALTPEGQEYVSYAKKIIALEDEAENRLHNMVNDRSGCIRIAMMSSAAYTFSERIAEYARRYPMVQVDVDMFEGAGMLNALSQQNYDFYFANEHMLPMTGEIFEYAVTGEEQLHLFFHKDIADSIDMNDWKTIGRHRFVSVSDSDMSLTAQIRRICLNRGIVPDVINHFNRADAVVLSVNSGMGIAMLPKDMLNFYGCPNVAALPIEGEDARIRPVIAWHKGNHNPHAAGLIEIIREAVGSGDVAKV